MTEATCEGCGTTYRGKGFANSVQRPLGNKYHRAGDIIEYSAELHCACGRVKALQLKTKDQEGWVIGHWFANYSSGTTLLRPTRQTSKYIFFTNAGKELKVKTDTGRGGDYVVRDGEMERAKAILKGKA